MPISAQIGNLMVLNLPCEHPSGRSHPWPAAPLAQAASCLSTTRKFWGHGASTVVVAPCWGWLVLGCGVVGVFNSCGNRDHESAVRSVAPAVSLRGS